MKDVTFKVNSVNNGFVVRIDDSSKEDYFSDEYVYTKFAQVVKALKVAFKDEKVAEETVEDVVNELRV